MGEPLDPLLHDQYQLPWNGDGRIIRYQPAASSPIIREHGNALPEDEGYRQAWAPCDDDVLIYGRTFGSSPTTENAAARGSPPEVAHALESYHDDYSLQSLSRESLVDLQTPVGPSSVLVPGNTHDLSTASVPFGIRSPRTQEEVELLRVVDEVNPQGYAEASLRVDIAHQTSVQGNSHSSTSSDRLDHHANQDLCSQTSATREVSEEDTHTGVRAQSTNVTHHYPSTTYSRPIQTTPPFPKTVHQHSRSSLRIRRARGNMSLAGPPSSATLPTSSSSINRHSSFSSTSSERTLATANDSSALSGKRKRRSSFSSEQSISPAQREWNELSDDIQDNPAKKRRISAHLAREPVLTKSPANVTINKRSRSESLQDSPLLRKNTPLGLEFNTLTNPQVFDTPLKPATGKVSNRNHKPGSQTSSRGSSFSTRLEEEGIPSISEDFLEMQTPDDTFTMTVESAAANQLPVSATQEPAALSTSPFQNPFSGTTTRSSRPNRTSNVTNPVPGRSRILKPSVNSRQKTKTKFSSVLAQEILDGSSSLPLGATVQSFVEQLNKSTPSTKAKKPKTLHALQAVRRSKRLNERL